MSSKLVTIIGYCDNLSVKPGGKVRFMVSSENPVYNAEIVRLVHADPDPRGPGFKEEKVATSLTGEYKGTHRDYPAGSYVNVDLGERKFPLRSLTVHAWVYPTLPGHGKPQAILTADAPSGPGGFSLYLTGNADLALSITNASGETEVVQTGVPLRTGSWYSVAATYNGETGEAAIQQAPTIYYGTDDTKARTTKTVRAGVLENVGSRIAIGAGTRGSDGQNIGVTAQFFNGKIDSPKLFSRVLDLEEVEALGKGGAPSASPDAGLLGDWDFASEISSIRVRDRSTNKLDGQSVNSPKRGVTGRNWTGNEIDFKRAPTEYSAIHFHQDDIDDCLWDVDFTFEVPDGFKSAIYAAKLEANGYTEYIPFFVRPKDGAASKIAFLVPTFTYLAYANEHEVYQWYVQNPLIREYHGIRPDFQYPVRAKDRYLFETPLKSVYSIHDDWTSVCYASLRRPLLSIRPDYRAPLRGGGVGQSHLLSADLCLVDWLEQKGFQFDIITDHDLNIEGLALLSNYSVVLTGNHPEYVSGRILDSLDGYLRSGGHLMYLGGNGFFWVTSVDPERPHIIEVRKWPEPRLDFIGEYYHSTTGELGGYWFNRGRAPQRLVGVGFTSEGYDKNTFYRRQSGSFDAKAAFIFEGIGKDELIGDFDSLLMHYGAAGDEIDMVDAKLGTPPNTLVLATATEFSPSYWPSGGGGHGSFRMGVKDPRNRSDLIYSEYPNGGAVFSVGSMSWMGCLYYNKYNNNVSKITENVLRRFSSS